MSRRDTPPTIIGVMPPGVRFLPSPATAQEPNYNVNALVDFWMPMAGNPERMKAPFWDVVGRLRDGATVEQARAELEVITSRQAKADPDFDKMTPQLQALTDNFNADARRILLPLFGAAALVLLIACGNVAALLLVRGLHRQDEYAVRTALGVRRLALFRQVSVESLLLALLGSALGVGLAIGIVKIFKVIAGPAIPRLDAVTTVWPVLISGLAVALIGAVVAGLLPALRASRLDAMSVIKSAGPKSSAGRGERRLLRAVTIGQTALTLALLMGAGLLLRTTSNLARVDSGYNTGQLLNMTVTAVQGDWNAFHTRALERVSAIPGVEGAAFAWGVPLTGNNWPGTFEFEGQPPVARPIDAASLPVRAVTPGYFNILRMALTRRAGFSRLGHSHCAGRRHRQPRTRGAIFPWHQRNRQEGVAIRRTSAAANGNHRRRGQQPDRRPDPATRAGDLSLALAGKCLFKGPAGPHCIGPAWSHGRRSTRAA